MRAKAKDWRSKRNIAWAERYIRLPEGRFVGKPLKMAPFMKEDFRAIFDNPHGTRRAIISRGRKNAKTVEAGLITLLFLCGPESKPNSQLFSTAQSREQASVIFHLMAKMIRMSPDLNAVVGIRDTIKELYCPGLGTVYKALSAEVKTSMGLSPRLCIHDELGQVRGPTSALYEAMETATAAQEEPLTIIISTQAPTDADLLSILIDDGLTGADPRTVVRLQTAPMEVDTFSTAAIKAANPAFDIFMNKAEVLKMAESARRMPSSQAQFENLILNRRIDASSPAIARSTWAACGVAVVPDFRGLPVYAGLDLSSVLDLTAFVPIAPVGNVWHARPTFWLPEHTASGLRNLPVKSKADRVPYDIWHDQGFLATTPGKTIDFRFIAAFLAAFVKANDVRKIGYDRWRYDTLKPLLREAGVPEEMLDGDQAVFVPIGQGFQTISPAFDALETVITNGKLAHAGHPVLTMCANNATVQMDPTGNRKLSKLKSHGRIDGLQALVMAMSVASTYHAQPELDIMAMVG